MTKDNLSLTKNQVIVLVNRIFIVFSIIYLFFDSIIVFDNISEGSDISISIGFTFFFFLAIYFLISKYKQHYFEIMWLNLLPVIILITLSNINSSTQIIGVLNDYYDIGLSYFVILVTLIIDIIVITYLWKKDQLNIDFLTFLNRKNKNKNKEISVINTDKEAISITHNKNQLENEKNNQLLALILFMILPIASNIGANIPYILLNFLNNNYDRINYFQIVQFIGLPYSFSGKFEITLFFFLLTLLMELLSLLLILILFYNKQHLISNWINKSNNSIIFFISTFIIGFFLFVALSFFIIEESIITIIVNLLLRPIMLLFLFPFLLIPFFMYNKKLSNPKLACEGLIILLCYSITIFISLFLMVWLPFDIKIQEFGLLSDIDLRPTLIIFFLPFVARTLWTEKSG